MAEEIAALRVASRWMCRCVWIQGFGRRFVEHLQGSFDGDVFGWFARTVQLLNLGLEAAVCFGY